MMRMVVLLVAVVVGVSGAGEAAAQAPAKCPDLAGYRFDREKDFAAQAGDRLLAEIRECNQDAYSTLVDSVRHQIQADETAKFANQRRYVIWAFGAAWALLALAALGIWLRQGKLRAQIDELEARLRKAA